MKKTFTAILLLAVSLSLLASCNTGTGTDTPGTSAGSDTTNTESEESTVAPENTLTPSEASELGYIIVTDTVPNDGKTDVSDELQALINENPNRTIYFPDGVYLLNKPILTPADPKKSVDLQLSNYAILRAKSGWSSSYAMVRLGAKNAANDISTPGSCYSFTGGIIDGGGKAIGISIEGGRETAIRNVSIKNTVTGIYIGTGANSNSSDADISDVNIVGCGGDNSVGVLVKGYDNTFTNMRIANVCIGIKLQSAGNMLRNIHPLYYTGSTDYEKSCGFYDEGGNNWYDICYSDQFRCGFYVGAGLSNVYDNCFCFWYSAAGGKQTAFRAGGQFNSLVTSIRAGFHSGCAQNSILEVAQAGGSGVFEYVLAPAARISDKTYEQYLTGKVIG